MGDLRSVGLFLWWMPKKSSLFLQPKACQIHDHGRHWLVVFHWSSFFWYGFSPESFLDKRTTNKRRGIISAPKTNQD